MLAKPCSEMVPLNVSSNSLAIRFASRNTVLLQQSTGYGARMKRTNFLQTFKTSNDVSRSYQWTLSTAITLASNNLYIIVPFSRNATKFEPNTKRLTTIPLVWTSCSTSEVLLSLPLPYLQTVSDSRGLLTFSICAKAFSNKPQLQIGAFFLGSKVQSPALAQ